MAHMMNPGMMMMGYPQPQPIPHQVQPPMQTPLENLSVGLLKKR